MYVPVSFVENDRSRIQSVMDRFPFALLVSTSGSHPIASHVPILYLPGESDWGLLTGHLARGNPQCHHLSAGQEVLVIFHGPHAYISPRSYVKHPSVPTWNYVAVHAYGTPDVISDPDRALQRLDLLVDRFERGPNKPWAHALPADYRARMLQGLVAFDLPISRIEAQFKLSQNRSAEEIERVANTLLSTHDAAAQTLGQWMMDADSIRTSDRP